MKYKIEMTNQFIKQYDKVSKQNNFKESEFIKILKMLINNDILPIKYNNHLLRPKSNRYRGVSCTTRYIIRI